MQCPYCGCITSKVLDSRPVEENKSIRRRRQCEECNNRFTTYENVELMPISVIKSNHTREPFDRDKLLRSIVHAFDKRKISAEELDCIVHKIETQLCLETKKEVTSKQLGEIIMEKIKSIDEVAYIRFASVYKNFTTIDEFIKEMNKIKKEANSKEVD